MIDLQIAQIARLEYEERIRSLPLEERVLNDILSDEVDTWLTDVVGHWQSWPVGGLLSPLGKGLASVGNRFQPIPAAALDSSLVGQERSGVPG